MTYRIEIPTANLGYDHAELGKVSANDCNSDRLREIPMCPPKSEVGLLYPELGLYDSVEVRTINSGLSIIKLIKLIKSQNGRQNGKTRPQKTAIPYLQFRLSVIVAITQEQCERQFELDVVENSRFTVRWHFDGICYMLLKTFPGRCTDRRFFVDGHQLRVRLSRRGRQPNICSSNLDVVCHSSRDTSTSVSAVSCYFRL